MKTIEFGDLLRYHEPDDDFLCIFLRWSPGLMDHAFVMKCSGQEWFVRLENDWDPEVWYEVVQSVR